MTMNGYNSGEQQAGSEKTMKVLHDSVRLGVLVLLIAVGRVWAHDFWLEAAPFYTEPGKPVDVSIHIGNEYAGDSMPNIVSWYTDFSLYDANGKRELPGELGRDPAGYFKPAQSGTFAVGYQSTFTYAEIEPDTFIKYLNEEGLEHAIAYRSRHGQNDQPGKERYIRHAKLLVQAGTEYQLDQSRVNMGYELEIIPQENPYHKRRGNRLIFQVLFQNQPAEDLLLIGFSKNHPERVQRIRTGADGRAAITLDDIGPWLVKAVKLLRLEGQEAEWQSHWASLTFAVR